MSSSAKHQLKLREEGLVVSTEDDKNKCEYTMTTSGEGAKVSTKSTDLIEVISGKKIVFNINNNSQEDLEKKEQDFENPYIYLKDDQIVLSFGTSSLFLSKDKISIKADTIEIEGSKEVKIKTNAMSMESGGATNIKSTGSMSIKGASVDVKADSAASVKGSITKIG